MNLIICTQKCRHQRGGYCQLDEPAPIICSANQHCCYFDPPNPEEDIKRFDGLKNEVPQSTFEQG